MNITDKSKHWIESLNSCGNLWDHSSSVGNSSSEGFPHHQVFHHQGFHQVNSFPHLFCRYIFYYFKSSIADQSSLLSCKRETDLSFPANFAHWGSNCKRCWVSSAASIIESAQNCHTSGFTETSGSSISLQVPLQPEESGSGTWICWNPVYGIF